MNKITYISIFLVLCVLSSRGEDDVSNPRYMAVIPAIETQPVIDGKLEADEWKNAVRLDVSHLCESSDKPAVERRAEILLARDNNYLYCAAVCEVDMENLALLQERFLKGAVYGAPRVEMFFGNRTQFTQIITDYMGRVYKNFKEPFFCKVSHSDKGYTIEYAIPLKLITRSKTSDLIANGNFYYVATSDPDKYFKATQLYSWFPAPGVNFHDTRYFGALLLETPREIAQAMITGHEKNIENLAKSGGLATEDANALKDTLSTMSASFPSSIDTYAALLPRLNEIKDFACAITEKQRGSFIATFGATPQKLLPAQTVPWQSVPEKWTVKKIQGKDYWYMYTALGIEEMEKAGIMDLPLFKEGMFMFRPDTLPDFLPPNGKNYKILEKYPKAFTITTSCGGIKSGPLSKNMLSYTNADDFATFLNQYENKNFVAFFGDETGDLQNGDLGNTIKEMGRPLPVNRKEACEAFKYNYFHTHATGKKTPFRNAANSLSPEMRKHASNATGTFLHHIVASFGDMMGGHEMGETMDNTATYMAFARGAARQYDQPWRNYSVTYGHQYLPGATTFLQCATIDSGPFLGGVHRMLSPRCRVSEYCYLNHLYGGSTIPIQKYILLHTYMCGPTIEHSEADITELTALYDDEEKIKSVDPLAINLREQKLYLSPIAKMRSYFYENIVKKHDRGVSVTPVGLVFDRYHGYMPLYGGERVWGFFVPNEAEKMMWALDLSVFQRKPDNKTFSNSPYGNIFDVLTNDADKKTLDSYRVLLPVGDTNFADGFSERLIEYVKNGGTLMLNTGNLAGANGGLLPEGFLGCKITPVVKTANSAFSRLDNSFIFEDVNFDYTVVEPSGAKVMAVTADSARAPVALSNEYGKGRLILTTPLFLKEPGSTSKMLKIFDHLMRVVRAEALPIQVDTQMEYLINRNKNGWVVSLFNNYGIPPNNGNFKAPPQVDPSQARQATITLPASLGKVRQAIDWWSGTVVPFKTSDDTVTLTTNLPGGDTQLIEFIME